MNKLLILITLALLFCTLLFAADENTAIVPDLIEVIDQQRVEIEKIELEIRDLKNKVKLLRSDNSLLFAGLNSSFGSVFLIVGLTSLLVAAIGFAVMKKSKKPELCPCARRREKLTLRRMEEEKLNRLNNC